MSKKTKVFRVTVLDTVGFVFDVEARDEEHSARIVRKALDKGIKRPEDTIYENTEISNSHEIEREDAQIISF